MQKQISYPTLIPRLFSTTLDLFFISFIITIIMNIIAKIIYVLAFREFLIEKNINWLSLQVETNIFYTKEFMDYIQINHKILLYFGCILLVNIIAFILMGAYFIGFWIYKGATPGKMLMKMKLVDASNLQTPTKWQFIKRYIGYATGLFGIWFIIFTKQHQALHDKIAGTVVIKT